MKPLNTDSAIKAMLERERKLYVQRNPKSQALSVQASAHWLRGVPLHWMVDWGLPFPLFIKEAQGITLKDADGNTYADFCLGDTGAMFGRSPKVIAECHASRLERGVGDVIIKHSLPWHVSRVGARIDEAVHHCLLNRGVVITPFHNMMLICPATTKANIGDLIETLEACVTELLN